MPKGRGKFKQKKEKPEFDQQIVDLARVTRVTEGGKQLSFRVCIIIGNRKGRVGYGVAKGKDVQIAVEKAVRQASKNIMTIPLVEETVPHRVEAKFKAAKVMIQPAPKGSGIIAGGATRIILEMAGVPNASSKSLGKTTNKLTNVLATFKALQSFLPAAVKAAQVREANAADKKSVRNVVAETEKKEAKKEVSPKKKVVKKVISASTKAPAENKKA
ncbi:30S ribosomal protein S5 [Patescibacteria group bacterium]|nr:30S ribosomal protein S5 [Patescibacteria group bacterium]MBU1721590.1 30S ribosomal protein S5 [Patescibacteria group bacterium]MBU1901816.1 30S ribosomal protein S5 [Patescibacteria group bacterium]